MSKKNFKNNNPALGYIINPEGPDKEPQQAITDVFKQDKKPKRLKVQENKSKRLNLLVKPSTHQELKRIADESDTSINNLINLVLENYIREVR